MDGQDWLAEPFKEHRTHLRSVAYRMLGSAAEAEDAVQESWLRLSLSDRGVDNLRLADDRRRARVPGAGPRREPAMMDGTVGLVWAADVPGLRSRSGRRGTRSSRVDLIADPVRLRELSPTLLD